MPTPGHDPNPLSTAALRDEQRPFPTRADVVRYCLATVAASVAITADVQPV